ncbi:MAG TPA: hypothetical protein VFV33_04320 [Gemmatimonadaceae bacterium]|nr:hypothetical protein [Gemmatimonadaceae bacterium]
MMAYDIGIGVHVFGPVDGAVVALVVSRKGRDHLVRWKSSAAHAHAAALEGVARARALRLREDAPRVIRLRQRSVVDVIREDDVVWSSARAPGGEHPTVTLACDAAQTWGAR